MAKKSQRLLSNLLSLLFYGRLAWLSRRATSTAVATAAAFPSSSPLPQHQHLHPPTAEMLAATRTLRPSSPPSLFPYFMLVALEAGGLLRGATLLLLFSLIRCVGAVVSGHVALQAMAAAAFCGLRASRFRTGRAVLPKWFMEEMAAEGVEAMRGAVGAGAGRRVVCMMRMPRVMVEGFLREYLGAEAVVGREMKVLWGFYTGLMEEGMMSELKEKKIMEESDAVGFSASLEFLQHPLSHCCKVLCNIVYR